MYHFAICDDLQEDRSLIRSMLADFAAERAQPISCAEYASGEALMAGCIGSGVRFDLIFLDIYMDGMDGMEVAHVLREAGVEAVLVFLTTTPDFAVQSYEVGALSYLLKPVAPEKLVAVLDCFLALCRPRSVFLQGRLFLTGDIVSAESCNKTILLHFKTGTT
ncbi:MAG: LytTR family DNA-binding domain-containing protein, partial [Pseudoflavonifractor sp.]